MFFWIRELRKREAALHRKTIVMGLMGLFSLASASAFGAEVKGMIISRTGDTLTVKSEQGNVTVVLTDNTKTKDNKGLLGVREEQMSDVVLIPGLKVDIDGTADNQGRVIANTITVDGDDLETSEMIQAGVHPTATQVAQNVNDIEEHTNRFTALAEYDLKGEATVKFDVGSNKISAQDQEELKNLAQTATGLKGYIIEVTGYADSSGSAAINTKLSEDRAKAVVTFLMQQGNVPVRHIVAPGAMGEYGAAAPNETKAGRAENRRVVVKVLVNKGIAGS
jgi:OmpA-OmpF porin, OOP family